MKKILLVFALLVFIVIIILIFNSDKKKSAWDQLIMLENGNLKEKMIAADFMGQSKNSLAIPILIKYIDAQEDLYPYKNKSPESLSCVITVSLSEITSRDIWNTCCYYAACQWDNKIIVQKWKDWYANEYPKWLEQQK